MEQEQSLFGPHGSTKPNVGEDKNIAYRDNPHRRVL